MSELGKPWHKRHSEWETFDKITLEVTPRWKTSGLSGDEWRFSVAVHFWFKGQVVHTTSFHRMETAIMMLGAEWIKAGEPIPDTILDLEKDRCDNPGCAEYAVYRYTLKEEFSRSGEKLDATESYSKKYRQFCGKHQARGDCGREDADVNYIKEKA